MSVPAMMFNELSSYTFIHAVPVEIIREEVLRMEPALMWTGTEDAEKSGGILWRMQPELIERVQEKVSARYALYGQAMKSDGAWSIEVYLDGGQGTKPRMYGLADVPDSELQQRMAALTREIAGLIKKESTLSMAEEDIRRYMGGLSTYEEVLVRMKGHVDTHPESIPVLALLLDLYKRDRGNNGSFIVKYGNKIISMMDSAGDSQKRYLLSLSLDPFEAVAEVYEKGKRWEDAIFVRNRALVLFPYHEERHKENLGRDYYHLARESEQQGLLKKGRENYRFALEYLPASSDYAKRSEERLANITPDPSPAAR